VLEVEDGKALLLSEKLLDCVAYHDTDDYSVTWETCTLRGWMNEAFFAQAFNAAEQSKIAETELSTANVNSGDGYCETVDRVFLIDQDAAKEYEQNGGTLVAQPSAWASVKAINSENYWALRSLSGSSNYICDLINPKGGVSFSANVSRAYYIRPALWLDLGEAYFRCNPKAE